MWTPVASRSKGASVVLGVLAGVVASALLVLVLGMWKGSAPRDRLVAEDASGHLERVAIHYVPGMDARALPVWTQLFRVLPEDVEIVVAVQRAADFERFRGRMAAANVPRLERFRPVVVGHALTTWSRDRLAALEGDAILAPPRVTTPIGPRAGDWEAPFAIARDVYGASPKIADLVFEGGDFAASEGYVFADANLIGRNLGRGDATKARLEAAVRAAFSGQQVVWLGDAAGEVPEHHIMMYMVPLDDREVLVGDVRRGAELAPGVRADADPGHAARFDRVAELLAARGFVVHRVPVVVLPGAGSYLTYTNALFDRDATGKVVYLPTYRTPALDAEAARIYERLGYRVVPIDVSTIHTLNGSLGCLVNVLARG